MKTLDLEESVQFLGVREDVADILQAFDLFLLPSLFEGLPVTMIEAQAAGLPCVISDKVPVQCDITGNTKVVPLEVSTDKWADVILGYTVVTGSLKELAAQYSDPIVVENEPLANFYTAEEYHQKYLDKTPGGYCHVPLADILWVKTVDPMDYA